MFYYHIWRGGKKTMSIERVQEAVLPDSKDGMKTVRKGDKVVLCPKPPPAERGDIEDDFHQRFAREAWDKLRRRLGGIGPFKIQSIWRGSCGGHVLYLEPSGSGFQGSDFMAV
ncbi:MAG: hypothetical protein ABH833_02735 [Parcubacteria group bacterium]